MAKLPRVTARQLVRVATRLGFSFSRQSGSHAIYINSRGTRATIPIHGSAVLHPKIVATFIKDAGVDEETFKKLL